jgi:4-hydroxybenzoyl-CoA thioesterase/acyl-CoA thioester hydrolase
MPSAFSAMRRVEFRDTDAAGIAHFSVFFQYMEEVEHAFLRSLGLSVLSHEGSHRVSWPRVAAHCEYAGPVRFEDVLDIALEVTRLGEKSVTYSFTFTHDGRAVAAGEVTAVCCDIPDVGVPRAITIPDAIAARLAAARRP